jgi:hypothetical protein
MEAYDEDDVLVDRFTLNVKHAKEIQVRNPEDPNAYWSAEIPTHCAMIEDSSAQFIVTLTGENEEALRQSASISIDNVSSWSFQPHLSGDRLSL